MAVKIEILDREARRIRAAFYYPVPPAKQTPLANDPTREPAGIRLSAPEVQELKDGALFELISSVPLRPGATKALAKTKLEAAWTDLQPNALAAYEGLYRFVAGSWDGSIWSNI